MKISTQIIPLLILISLFACKKKEPDPITLPDWVWGTASALKNGEAWKAYPSCLLNEKDERLCSIGLDSFLGNDYLVENLSFYDVPLDTGIYQTKNYTIGLTSEVSAFNSYWDYDLPLGDYRVIEDAKPNYIAIDSYDTLTREIKGRFEITLIVRKRPYVGYPDTLRFREGKFHGKFNP